METKEHLLLVEDDNALGYLLSEYLRIKGYHVSWAKNGLEALELLKTESFRLAILDVMMPGMDGFSLAEQLRVQEPAMPFIFLTARALKIDVMKGLSLGAVDYLKKPIDEEELVLRIQALLQWLPGKQETAVQTGQLRLGQYRYDGENQALLWKDEVIRLTSRENEILSVLLQYRNRVCPHKELLTRIWGKNDYFNRKSLNVFITRLRKYLEQDPGVRIENVHNQGFVLIAEE